MVAINTRKITQASQVESLKSAGLITAAQAKKLLAGLKAPKTKVSDDTAAARTAARQAVTTKGSDKVPTGYLSVDRADVANKNFAFSKLVSASSELYYYLPMERDLEGRGGGAADLLRTVRNVAEGALNFMTSQQVLVESDDYMHGIWRPGDTGFHPRELEDRLAKAIKPFGLTLATLPNAIRSAAQQAGMARDTGSHDPTERAFNAANFFENRNSDAAWQAAKEFTPLAFVKGRNKSWALEMKPAAGGMVTTEVVERPGTPAPRNQKPTPEWVNKGLEELEYARWDPSLPAGFDANRPTPATGTVTVVTTPPAGTSSRNASQALALGRQLENTRDPNLVPRNVTLAGIESAVATLRTGALEVAAAVKGTRGTQATWGGELVHANDLTALADSLEVLAARMRGGPTGTSTMAPEKAMSIAKKLDGVTDADRVPRNISRADVEGAATRLGQGASEVERAVAGTRGNSTTWGGVMSNAAGLRAMASDLQVLALKMKQAGY